MTKKLICMLLAAFLFVSIIALLVACISKKAASPAAPDALTSAQMAEASAT